MTKPLIGITPLFDDKKEIYFMRSGYTRGIEKAGGIPVMLPLTTDPELIRYFADTIDGFLFSGGHDLTPSLYGAKPIDNTYGDPVYERDLMEKALLQEALKRDKPVLGVCRGIQMINVVMGGDLYQDLPTERPSEIQHLKPHKGAEEKPQDDENTHWVEIEKDSPLHQLLGKELLNVNSYHHQAVKKLAPSLKVMGRALDGVVESVYSPEHYFVWGVQWHPELIFENDKDALKLFEEFVRQSARKAQDSKG